jgi:hypothetical protein
MPEAKDAIQKIKSAYVPEDTPPESHLELVISMDDTTLRVRGLAAFLEFIDRVYGRLDPRGLRSYAHRPQEHIRIREVRTGSFELIFAELLAQSDKVTALLIVYILMKNLPDILKSLAQAYKDLEEARFTRKRREILEEQLRKNPDTQKLKSQERQQVAGYLDEILTAEREAISQVGEFTQEHIKYISLHLEGTEPGN